MSQENFVVTQDVATLMTDAAVKGYTPQDLELICPSFKKLLPYIPQCRAGLRNIAVSAPSVIYKMWLRYSPPTDLAPAENIPQILHNIRNTLAALPCTADLSLLHCASNQLYECPSKEGPLPIFFLRTSKVHQELNQEEVPAIHRIQLSRPQVSDSFTLLQVLTLSYGCCCTLIHPQGIVSIFGTASNIFRTMRAFTTLCNKSRQLLSRFESPSANQTYAKSFYTSFALGIHQRISLPLAFDQLQCRLSIWNWLSHDPAFLNALEDFYVLAHPHRTIARDSIGTTDGKSAAKIVCLADALMWCDCLTCTTGLQDM